jgi:hypothetical protein
MNNKINDFFDMWEKVKNRLYVESLEEHLRIYEQNKYINAILEHRKNFANDIEKIFKFTESPSGYWKSIIKLFSNNSLWKNLTIQKALDLFLKIVSEETKYFNKYKSENLNDKGKKDVYALFQITTLFIVSELHLNKDYRALIGINEKKIIKMVNPIKNIILLFRASKRVGAFERFYKQGNTSDQSRKMSDSLYPPDLEDIAYERGLVKTNYKPYLFILGVIIIFYLLK